MKPGRELDAIVAEKVMGKVKCQSDHYGESMPYCMALPDSPTMGGECPCYSTDIAAAWAVVEKLDELGWTIRIEQTDIGWGCGLNISDIYEEAETAPHAICLAALKAVGWEG